MKKLLTLLLIITISWANAQKTTIGEKKVTTVFPADSLKKDEIFALLNKWIALNYNSAKNVIQMSDKQQGIIIVKGVQSFVMANAMKAGYPKNKNVPEAYPLSLNHMMQIDVKDNRFRVSYNIIGLTREKTGLAMYDEMYDIFYEGIKLNGGNEKEIDQYKELIKLQLRRSLLGRKRIEKIMDAIPVSFEETNKNILASINLTMLSIYGSIKKDSEDDW